MKQNQPLKLGYIIYHVDSVPDTLSFYEKAFGLKGQLLGGGDDYGEISTGETILSFAQKDFIQSLIGLPHADISPEAVAPVEINWTTEDVDSAYEKAVAAGAVSLKAPLDKPWGQRVAYVRDNNGFLVGLCTPMN